LEGHTGEVYAVALSVDGRHALSGGEDHTVRWWNVDAGTALVLEGHIGEVYAVALSVDGRQALSGGDDNTLRWWDLSGKKCLALFPCEAPVRAVALCSGDPTLAAAGLANGAVLFFRLVSR
jgi:WD40 repeat protein